MQFLSPPPFHIQDGGGKKVAYGINNTTPFKNIPSTHAEMQALIRTIKWQKRHQTHHIPLNLLVIRLNKHGILGESRPCYHCISYLHSSSIPIKWVYYSTEAGTIVKERFKHMVATKESHATISSGMRKKMGSKLQSY